MRPGGGLAKKFGAKRRMRFKHNKVVKRKIMKKPTKGIAKGKDKFLTKKHKGASMKKSKMN